MSLNKVMLIGNVGKKPEVRYLENQQNVKVASFSFATTERYKAQTGDMREHTEWHNVVAWRGLADLCERYIDKGTQLYIEGKIRTRDWTDQNGNKRYVTEIIADAMQLLGRKQDGSSPYQQPAPIATPEPVPSPAAQDAAPMAPSAPQMPDTIEDDDLPF